MYRFPRKFHAHVFQDLTLKLVNLYDITNFLQKSNLEPRASQVSFSWKGQ